MKYNVKVIYKYGFPKFLGWELSVFEYDKKGKRKGKPLFQVRTETEPQLITPDIWKELYEHTRE